MQTKTTIKFFSIADFDREATYLRKMHQAGWKFIRVSGGCCYHFEKCTPADVIYQLDYNRNRHINKEDYVQLFQDCGWEYLQDYAGYSYFRQLASAAGENAAIFSDISSRVAMMQHIFRWRLLPLILLLLFGVFPQFVYQLYSGAFMGITVVLGMLLCFCAGIMAVFFNQYFKLKH